MHFLMQHLRVYPRLRSKSAKAILRCGCTETVHYKATLDETERRGDADSALSARSCGNIPAPMKRPF